MIQKENTHVSYGIIARLGYDNFNIKSYEGSNYILVKINCR